MRYFGAVSFLRTQQESNRISSLLIGLLLGSSEASLNSTAKGQSVSMTMPTSALQLHKDVRKACVSALILMRNKGAVEPLRLLELFFKILSVVPDKALRELLHRHIVNDIRNINKKGKRDEQVNRRIQSFLHRVISLPQDGDEATELAAKRATDMVCELYRRSVWTDDRAVAILASAVVSKNSTVMARSMRFFLNIEEKMAEDKAREEEEKWIGSETVNLHQHNRKTKVSETMEVILDAYYRSDIIVSNAWILQGRIAKIKKELKDKAKAQRAREGEENWEVMTDDKGVEAGKKLYPAIEMLRDPQGLAESVFKRLKDVNSQKYEVKLLMMNFLTRLVGNHKLLLMPLYPFLQRYMGGHQRDVTAVLAYTVQACHDNVPPDEIYGILKTIAHNFITERCSGEQMAVGINAARAICARVPSVLSIEESRESSGSTVMDIEAFARDLAAYARHRDRSCSIAGKGWANFIREVHPSLLQGKDRGMVGSALHRNGEKPLRYGEQKVATGVEGADLLVAYELQKAASKKRKASQIDDDDDGSEGLAEERMNDDDEVEEEDDGWDEVEEEEDGEENDWNDVEHGEDDEEDDEEDEDAPQLVVHDGAEKPILDVSKMTSEERDALKQEVSANRIFSSDDFVKMRKLVEREKKAKRDPREAARRKRAIAQGREFEELSDDSSVESDEEGRIKISGAVNPGEIMADSKRKRQSKAERLESILAGRSSFEAKKRAGGSTDTEKKRTKNFVMSKFSFDNRKKRNGKSTRQDKKTHFIEGTKDSKKRRRKV
jgi:protein SDA1